MAADFPPYRLRTERPGEQLGEQFAHGKVPGEGRMVGIVAFLTIAAPQAFHLHERSLPLALQLLKGMNLRFLEVDFPFKFLNFSHGGVVFPAGGALRFVKKNVQRFALQLLFQKV